MDAPYVNGPLDVVEHCARRGGDERLRLHLEEGCSMPCACGLPADACEHCDCAPRCDGDPDTCTCTCDPCALLRAWSLEAELDDAAADDAYDAWRDERDERE